MQFSDVILLLILLGCMASYIPVFMCLFFTATLGFLFFTDIPLLLLFQTIFRSMDNFALVVVLFFILCGNIMTAGSIVEKLIKVANAMVSWLPGGLRYGRCPGLRPLRRHIGVYRRHRGGIGRFHDPRTPGKWLSGKVYPGVDDHVA
jgi:hypothetical protein